MSDAVEQIEVIVTDPRLPTDRLILEGIDVSREPVFTVGEVAKVFFARSAHWMRWLERKGMFVLDGDKECSHTVEEPGVNNKGESITKINLTVGDNGFCTQCGGEDVSGGRTDVGARRYTLADIEKMTHALAAREAISVAQLMNALHLVQIEAKVWSYLQ